MELTNQTVGVTRAEYGVELYDNNNDFITGGIFELGLRGGDLGPNGEIDHADTFARADAMFQTLGADLLALYPSGWSVKVKRQYMADPGLGFQEI